MKVVLRYLGGVALCALFAVHGAFAQGTAFTYQGRLQDGTNPATGTYDLTFALFNTNSSGSQVGVTLTNSAMGITNGVFTTTLDFGANFPGADRWLEISVRTNGGAFVTLSPRQKLAPAPYAIMAGGLAGGVPASQLTGTLSSAQLAGTYGNAVTFNNGADNFNGTFIGQFLGYSFIGGGFTGTFVGNGSGLAGLNAGALSSGTVPTAQMGGLTNHPDVSASGLAPGQVLAYNGTAWTNGPPSPVGPTPSNNIPVLLAYSGTNVAVNAAIGTHFRLVATNNFQLQNPTGASDSQRLVFELIQDATGGRSVSFGNAYKFGTDIPSVHLTTNATLRDFMTCVCSGTNFYVTGFIRGY